MKINTNKYLIMVKPTLKERLKMLLGISNRNKFECFVTNGDGNVYKGFLNLEESYFKYYGNKRKESVYFIN